MRHAMGLLSVLLDRHVAFSFQAERAYCIAFEMVGICSPNIGNANPPHPSLTIQVAECKLCSLGSRSHGTKFVSSKTGIT